MHRLVYCAMALVWLQGCHTIESERCAALDWGLQGLEDGRAGHAPSRLSRHADACARVGVVPIAAAWESGRQQGLGTYCQLPNALRQGESRRHYEGVCRDPRFEQLYEAARRLAEARSRMDDLDKQIDRLERSLRDSKLGDARRAERVGALRGLRRERDSALLDRREAAMALDRTRARLGI